MLAFGKTLLVFTLAPLRVSGLALLAVFGVLRRVTRSSLAALLLYLPFLATSLFLIGDALGQPLDGRHATSAPSRCATPARGCSRG